MEINREIKNITSAFVLEDNLTECVPYGSGHINDTYRLTYGTGKHYILQKMNRSIFTKPVELMENVSGVTAWLKKKIQENGGDVERETLNLVMTKDGLPYYVDEDGEYWRVFAPPSLSSLTIFSNDSLSMKSSYGIDFILGFFIISIPVLLSSRHRQGPEPTQLKRREY